MKLVCEHALAGPNDTADDVHWERRTVTNAVRSIQNQAAVYTFALRYWLSSKLMLSTGDDEADGGAQPKPKAAQPKPKTAQPKRDASREEKLRRIENGREKLGWSSFRLSEVSGELGNDLDAILKRLGEEWKAQQAETGGD